MSGEGGQDSQTNIASISSSPNRTFVPVTSWISNLKSKGVVSTLGAQPTDMSDLDDVVEMDNLGVDIEEEEVPPKDDNDSLDKRRLSKAFKKEQKQPSDDFELRRQQRETLFFLEDPTKRIDFVLAYKDDEKKSEKSYEKRRARQIFLDELEAEGLEIELEDKSKSVDLETYFVKLHATWEVIAPIAELLNLNKPLKMPKDFSSQTCVCCDPFEVSTDIIESSEDCFTAAFNADRLHMFEIDLEHKEDFFTNAERSLIVYEVLKRTTYTADKTDSKFGIGRMLREEMFTAAFPLHEGPFKPMENDDTPWEGPDKDRQRLYEAWARPGRFLMYQPLDKIRDYLGEKIAIYFAWLGFYTQMLIPVSILGIIAFVYGLVTLFANIPSEDICDSSSLGNTTMCPLCEPPGCTYWYLRESCMYGRITYIFDNWATVAFAAVMGVWSIVFIELWGRKQKEIQYDWDVKNLELEERPRPDFEHKVNTKRLNPINEIAEPYLPWIQSIPRTCCSWMVIIFMICLVLAAIIGVVIYRIIVATLLFSIESELIHQYAKIITTITAAVINLIVIVIMNIIYKKIAGILTDFELHRTETEYEDSFIFKVFLFQCVNFYGSIFYIAFFKGRFTGAPNDDRWLLLGKYKQDQCDPAGCLIELCIQLIIIMVGKQILNNAKELLVPLFFNWCRRRSSSKKETSENLYMRWEQDNDLTAIPPLGLFEEYLEMVIQFGFVTIFVAAFPLAPFCALLNNILEIRLDAYKFITQYRRPVARKAQDIGVWMGILQGIAAFAVMTNAFIIAYTSDFIPKIYYLLVVTEGDSLKGYLNQSLSFFDTNDFPSDRRPVATAKYGDPSMCRYRSYREPPSATNKYFYTTQFWHIFAARLIFVVVFEHFIYFLRACVAFIIPDTPSHIKQLEIYEYQLVKKIQFDATIVEMKEQRRQTVRHRHNDVNDNGKLNYDDDY